MWEFFKIADKNGDNKITLLETKRLFKKINIRCSEEYTKRFFIEHDVDNNKTLSFDEFVRFYDDLTRRSEVLEIFYEYAISYPEESALMTKNELCSFLEKEQGEQNCTEEYLDGLIKEFEPCVSLVKRREISLDGFLSMLIAESGCIFKPRELDQSHNMDLPLNNYFIASSHNTYLLDGQLRGESSTEAYVNALQRGCKCLELDCWDGPDGEPIIHHGYTLSKYLKQLLKNYSN